MKKIIQLTILVAIIVSCKKNKLPELATDTISDITSTSANCGGNITSNGGSSILDRGVCWNTSGSPTIEDNKTADGIGVGSYASAIDGLILGQSYYVRAYATNKNGTSYGNERLFTTELNVGDNSNGGVIFYVLKTGDLGFVEGEKHGLIVTETDQESLPWSNDFTLVGTTEETLGSGASNTSEIVATLGGGSYAASFCNNLSLDGQNDWYLPSKEELNLLFLSGVISNYAPENWYYHTSSEVGSENMWVQDMNTGSQVVIGAGSKTIPYLIRPIRSF